MCEITKEEAWALAKKQLNNETPSCENGYWHYGRLQIAELLDAIYEENSAKAPPLEDR